MIYYHGTTIERGRRILEDRKIIPTNSNTMIYPDTDYSRTTLGYVYLTTDANKALDFASRTQKKTGKIKIAIFGIDISDNDVEIDVDELKYDSNSSNEFRINHELILGEHVKRYAFIEAGSYKQLCKIIDNKKADEAIKNIWKTI